MMIRLVVTTASLRRRRVAITAYIIIAFVKNIKRNKSKNTKTKFETKFKLPSSSVCKNHHIIEMLQNDADKINSWNGSTHLGMFLHTPRQHSLSVKTNGNLSKTRPTQ
mgnify:CR=1 FL=1